MFGLHLGLEGESAGGEPGGVRCEAEDPRVGDAMIVFCGLESDDSYNFV